MSHCPDISLLQTLTVQFNPAQSDSVTHLVVFEEPISGPRLRSYSESLGDVISLPPPPAFLLLSGSLFKLSKHTFLLTTCTSAVVQQIFFSLELTVYNYCKIC